MRAKRGLGHVEVIVAFVLFVGFLIFGLYFFNPLNSERLLDSTLFYAEKAIKDNITTTIATYTVVLNQSVPNVVGIPLARGLIDGVGVRVEDEQGLAVNSEYESGFVEFDRGGPRTLFYIRFGDFSYLGTTISGAVRLTPDVNYTISSSDSKDVLSERKLGFLNASYYADYDSLRTAFNLPRRTDFAATINLSGAGVFALVQPIPVGLDVTAHQSREEVVREDGSQAFADVQVQVW